MEKLENKKPTILYSCYHTQNKDGENFIPQHILGYIISGSLTVYDGKQNFHFKEGDFRFFRRNRLAKFFKKPPEGGEFKSVSIFLDQETLRNISLEYDFKSDKKVEDMGVQYLPKTPMLKNYMDSLIPYLEVLNETGPEILNLKVKEAILLLLKDYPNLKNILFDFSEPGKVDLEAFMQQHYRFNVGLERFAYLTGRSLATFKRDFEKIFHTSPSRWLTKKRLEDAYFLIKDKGKAPSDAYVEVGFENLSHFSFAFKKAFGVAPSRL